MRFEIRNRPYDLYAVIGASAILVLVILLTPNLDVLRIILGLPFILFFPGYVLISFLYPERKKFFDKEGNEAPPPSEDEYDEDADKVNIRSKDRKVGRKKGKHRQSDDDLEKDEKDDPKGKGLDGLERIALSLGLSIAITPLIGLLLNYTYDWAPDTLGIRLIPILISQFAFISILGVAAIYKRTRVPPEDRFAIVIDLSVPEDYTVMDKVLTIGIVIMMVLSVSLLIYIIVVPREGEAFTELYLLGHDHKADNYPVNVYLDDGQFMYIGIGNHEHKEMNYTLVVTIDSGARNKSVTSFDDITISRTSQPSMEVIIPEDKTLEIQCNFSVLEVGSYKLRVLIFVDGKEYRDTHIWIKVFEISYLKTTRDAEMEFYVAGPGGDPSLIQDTIDTDAHLPVSLGIRNRGDEDRMVNLTITIGPTTDWMEILIPFQILEMDSNSGAYQYRQVNFSSSFGPFEILLDLPPGEWDLEFRFDHGRGSITIYHRIIVEAP